jgi:polyhydroxybutyrate depolymerase
MSNGGFMSVELACALSNRIAAVASVTGSMGLNRISVCNPSKPTPVMQINGTSDMTVAYNGTTQYASIPAVVDFWVDKNNCSPTPHQINVPNTNTTDGSTVEHYVYTQGNQDATVELFKVIGGGHTWPGAPIDLPLSGNTNRDIDASIEIWRFFSQFSLNHLLDTDEFELAADHIRIYPNPTDGDIQLEIQGSPTELTICDVAGREVATFKGGDIPSTYNFSEKGVFFISVFSNNQLVTEKVIVE